LFLMFLARFAYLHQQEKRLDKLTSITVLLPCNATLQRIIVPKTKFLMLIGSLSAHL